MPVSTRTPRARTRGSGSSGGTLRPSRGAFVCWFIERWLVHGEGDFYGRPFRLTPEQKRFVYRCYELRPDGSRQFRRVLRGRPKGDGKTELAAAIGCVELAAAGQRGFPGSPLIPVGAASFEQADLLFGAARTMISEGPLASFFEVFDTEILRRDGPGRMYRVAAAAGTNDGTRPTFLLADELHEWTGNKERVHLVLANGLAKRAEGWELAISTAGSDKDTLLGRLYDYGRQVQSGEVDDDTFLFDWLEAPDGFDLDDPEGLEAAVRSCNPHADRFWPIEGVLRRYREIPRFEFERYHLNRWTAAGESWLPPGAWDRCAEKGMEIPAGADVVLGVDIGLKHDRSAVVALCPREDGAVAVKARVFDPPGGGGQLDLALVEDAIRQAARDYRVGAVVYDPWKFERSAQTLSDEGMLLVEFPMSNERMAPASSRLYEDILAGRVCHDGDPVLAAHVAAGITKSTERGWRLTKANAKRSIDALMAMLIGHAIVSDQPKRNVYEDRDLLVI